MSVAKWHKASIIQTAPSGDCDEVAITVTDETSGICVVEIAMTIEEFGRMLHAPTYSTCRVRVGPVDKIGWKHESQEINVPTPSYVTRNTDKAAILAPFEHDGWRARTADLGNSHRRTGNGYRVTFTRLVPPEAP